VEIIRMKPPQLLLEFDKLQQDKGTGSINRGIFHRRVARVYETIDGIPTIFIIKPDMRRYWTRSAGLNDADEVALDLFRWQQTTASSEVA
jgi:hypothetical protein